MKEIHNTKYACELCGQLHDDQESALRCESLGIPEKTAGIREGDILTFEREVAGIDPTHSVLTYLETSGVVLDIVLEYNKRTRQHQHVFIVGVEADYEKGLEACELMVIMDNIREEGDIYFSPGQIQWKPGYAAAAKEIRCKQK